VLDQGPIGKRGKRGKKRDQKRKKRGKKEKELDKCIPRKYFYETVKIPPAKGSVSPGKIPDRRGIFCLNKGKESATS
jgi:hypothetical protein